MQCELGELLVKSLPPFGGADGLFIIVFMHGAHRGNTSLYNMFCAPRVRVVGTWPFPCERVLIAAGDQTRDGGIGSRTSSADHSSSQ